MILRTPKDIKRTILYYPTFNIPNGSWLRQALLYWDELASIVPKSYQDKKLISFSPDIEYLLKEGEFRPIRPVLLINQRNGWEKVSQFKWEFISIVSSANFQRMLSLKGNINLDSPIHIDKTFFDIVEFLKHEGLAKTDRNDRFWILFEENTALLYMSLLAKYLADLDINATVPGSDRKEYEKLIFCDLTDTRGFACLDIRFQNALPIPRDDVPLSKIIKFKHKRRSELIDFRNLIYDFQRKLSESENNTHLKDTIIQFKEDIEKGINDIFSLMKDRKIAIALGSVKSIIKVSSPTLWGSIGIAVDKATKIADLPLEWTISGIAVAGLIEVGKYLIDKRNEARATCRDSSFSYLYHAHKEGIIY